MGTCDLFLFIALSIILIGTTNVLIFLDNSIQDVLTSTLETTADTIELDTDSLPVTLLRRLLGWIQYQETQPPLFKKNETKDDSTDKTKEDSTEEEE